MLDYPTWVWKLIRNANFGDGGDGGDGGGGDAGGSESGGGGGDAGGTSGDTGGGTGVGDASGAGTGGDASATGDAGGTSGSIGGGPGSGMGTASGTDGTGAAASAFTASSGPGDAPASTVGGGAGAPGAALGAGDPSDPFGSDPGGLGFTSLGGPNPMDPSSPGFSQPMSTQGDFLAGGIAPTDPGAFTGLGPGTVGSNPGFGFGPDDAPSGSLTFGDPIATDPTAEMAAQAWPTGTVGAPAIATQADLDQLANPGTGLPVGTPSVLDPSSQPTPADNLPSGGITFTGGTGPTTVATDTQDGVSGGGTISPLGVGILGAGAGSVLSGAEGGVQLADGTIVPEPLDVLSSDQIVQQQQQMDAILAQWAQIIPPTDPRWAQVLQLVQQQVQGQPATTRSLAA